MLLANKDAGSLRPVCAARQPHLCILSLNAVTHLLERTGVPWGISCEQRALHFLDGRLCSWRRLPVANLHGFASSQLIQFWDHGGQNPQVNSSDLVSCTGLFGCPKGQKPKLGELSVSSLPMARGKEGKGGTPGALPTHPLRAGLGVAWSESDVLSPTCNSGEGDGVGPPFRCVLYSCTGDEEKGAPKLEDQCYFQKEERSLG